MKMASIGYLTSQYPASSHTFIRREIAALRRAGGQIKTYSVRRPSAAEVQAEADRHAFDETGYLLPPPPLAFAGAQLAALFQSPLRWLSTLRLALRHRPPGLRSLVWALFHFAEAIYLSRLLRRDDVGHLHNHFANSGATVGLLASRFLGIDWSLTLHGISETDYPAGLLLPEKVAMARFVCCVSHFGKAQAMRITPPREWPKFQLVRCGLELDALPPALSGPRDATSGGTIICVGRLSPEKAQAGLIDAFAALAGRHPDWRLLLVGDGPDRVSLEQQTQQAGLETRVEFAGRLPEQATLAAIAQADLLVLPSFMEGLPVVLMEAMALGVPVVSSNVAGIPELIDHGRSGLLVPASDWSALSAAIEQVIADPALGRTMAAAAKQRIAEEFDINRAVAPLAVRFGFGAAD